MSGRNKLKKARNSYCDNALKWGTLHLKRLCFYDSSQRQKLKKEIIKDYEI